MSLGTFNNSAYNPIVYPNVDPQLIGDARLDYDYPPDTRRSPSPGPSRPYPAYDRYVPPRPPVNSYRPGDYWGVERSERSYRPSADHYEPAYSADDWARQDEWSPPYVPPEPVARPASPPLPAGWPRGRRDVMAARMFEPSDAWKQSQAPDMEQDSLPDRYLEGRRLEPRREDYPPAFYPAPNSYRPGSPASRQRSEYRPRQSDSYRPTYDAEQWSQRRETRSPMLVPRVPHSRPDRLDSRYASYERSLSGSPPSSRYSSPKATRRLGGRSMSPASSRERSRRRSSSRSSIASSSYRPAPHHTGETFTGSRTGLAIQTDGLRTSTNAPYSPSSAYSGALRVRQDERVMAPPFRSLAAPGSGGNKWMRPPDIRQSPGVFAHSRVFDGSVMRDNDVNLDRSMHAIQQPIPQRKTKKRRGGKARRAKALAYAPFMRNPTNQTFPDTSAHTYDRSRLAAEPRFEMKVEASDVEVPRDSVGAASRTSDLLPSLSPPLLSTNLPDAFPMEPIREPSPPIEATFVTDVSPLERALSHEPLEFTSIHPPSPTIAPSSAALSDSGAPATSQHSPSLDHLPAIQPTSTPPVLDLPTTLETSTVVERPFEPINHRNSSPNLLNPTQVMSTSSPMSSTARSPSLQTPSPPRVTPTVLVAVPQTEEQEDTVDPGSSSGPVEKSQHVEAETQLRGYYPAIQTNEADSLREALEMVVAARQQYDVQSREERIHPVLMANTAIADLAPSTSTSAEALVREIVDGERSQTRMATFATLRSSLVDRVSARQESVEEKTERLRKEYLELHHQWVDHCAKLDNVNQGNVVDEVAAVAGRTTRRSAAVLGDAVRSDLEMEQIIASLGNEDMMDPAQLALRNVATIPDMISVTHGRVDGLFDDTNNLIEDPSSFYDPGPSMAAWTEEEQEIFKEKFAAHPKQFGIIAASLPYKTQAQCVLFYYLNKKTLIDFRSVVAAYGQKKKRGGRKTDKKKGGLLADIRQHDAEVSKGASSRRSTAASTSGGRRKRTSNTAEPRRAAPRRSTLQTSQVEPSPMTTPTPDPEPDVRPKRRRTTRVVAVPAEQTPVDGDDTTEDPRPLKRSRRGRKSKVPDDAGTATPPEPAANATEIKSVEQTDSSSRRKSAVTPTVWTEEDQALFLKLLAQYGDDFKRIAASMPHKTTIQVSSFYKSNLAELDLERVASRAPKRSPTPPPTKDAWSSDVSQYPPGAGILTPVVDGSVLIGSPVAPAASTQPSSTPLVNSRAVRPYPVLTDHFTRPKPNVSGWPPGPPSDAKGLQSDSRAPPAGLETTSPLKHFAGPTPYSLPSDLPASQFRSSATLFPSFSPGPQAPRSAHSPSPIPGLDGMSGLLAAAAANSNYPQS